jgi:hypothetical protein
LISLADCNLTRLNDAIDVSHFDCGEEKFNKFLKEKALYLQNSRMCNAYVFLHPESNAVVAYYTLSSDSIQSHYLVNSKKELKAKNKLLGLDHKKRLMRTSPAVKLGMMGIDNSFRGKGLGDDLLTWIKINLYNSDSICGYRYIILDAVNKRPVLNLYLRNEFDFLHPSEEEEKQHYDEEEL